MPLFGWLQIIFTWATMDHRPCAAYAEAPTHTHTHEGKRPSLVSESPLAALRKRFQCRPEHVTMCVLIHWSCQLGREPASVGEMRDIKGVRADRRSVCQPAGSGSVENARKIMRDNVWHLPKKTLPSPAGHMVNVHVSEHIRAGCQNR